MSESVRALMIGAHPDDCEFRTGGLTAKYRKRGDVVKWVSATDGSAGHHEMGGGPLARRRAAECREVARLADIEYEVLDNPDGKLDTDLVTREKFIRLIREFRPDVVFTHRPNDYHPDHRRTGILVQDASYLIRVPNICPLVPHLTRTPVIVYMQDGFTRPNPFTPDVVVAIDAELASKVRLLHCHTSQVYEWLPYDGGYAEEIPEGDAERLAYLHRRIADSDQRSADRFRAALVARYGPEAGNAVQAVEAFEISEYGRGLSAGDLDTYFPR